MAEENLQLSKKPTRKNNRTSSIIVLSSLLVALIATTIMIQYPQDIRNYAANINLGHVPEGCYYRRDQCTGRNKLFGNPTNCKPVLVCPTPTPTITPTPIPCTPRPDCLDASPSCQLPEPAGGWCIPTITPQPLVTTTPVCFPRP